jgi:hypothetical protein
MFCWMKQTLDGWLSLRWFWTTNLSTRTESWIEDLPTEEEHHGALNRGEADRLGPTGLGGFVPLLALVSPSTLILALWLLWPHAPRVAPPKLSHPLLCLHYWSFHLMSLLWVISMLLCLTCLHDFPTKQGLAALPCLSLACGFDERCWKSTPWCIMAHAWLV